MKNIEKYYDAIKQKLQTTDVQSLGCAVFDIRTGSGYCGDCDCKECYLKSLDWLNEEYKESKAILTDQEKEIVKLMIDFAHKCDCDVIHICKFQGESKCVYIYCKFKDKEYDNTYFIESPWLPKNMFKGMENGRQYTPEELGL